MGIRITRKQAEEAFQVSVQEGSYRGAARVLGIDEASVRRRVRAYEDKARSDYTIGPELPEGQELRGVSTYYDANGEIRSQWVKTRAEPSLDETITIIKDALQEIRSPEQWPELETPEIGSDRLLTVYPIADFHLGMFSWHEETGTDFDLPIAKNLLNATMERIICMSPSSDVAVILNLGDFFHSDSNENRTRRSGNPLDVDTRYAKVLKYGVNLMVETIIKSLQKHRKVIVRNIPGNHDPYASLALSLALEAYFRNEPRVVIDTNPGPFWWFKFGKVFLGAAHGDMAKPFDMPAIMAASQAKNWGETEYRYNYIGHYHQTKVGAGNKAGANWEIFNTIAPKDAWSHGMGFCSGRTQVSITHDMDRGEIIRMTHAVAPF